MKKKKTQNITVKYNCILQSIHIPTGTIVKESHIHNLVVNDGLERVAHLIGGLSSNFFEYLAIGVDNTAVLATDTNLGDEITRANVTPTDEGVGIIEYDHVFTVGTGEDYDIVEVGLFDGSTPSGGTMLNRLVVSPAHNLDINHSLRVILTITCVNA